MAKNALNFQRVSISNMEPPEIPKVGSVLQLKGMRIRDEYLCPIMYELFREPVVASDGHTYEREAIEKWLKTRNTSPRNGEPISGLLVANLNLKKLLQDLIAEVLSIVVSNIAHYCC